MDNEKNLPPEPQPKTEPVIKPDNVIPEATVKLKQATKLKEDPSKKATTKKIPKKSGKQPEHDPISAEMLAPGFVMLASSIHYVAARKSNNPAWLLTQEEAQSIGLSMGTITATLLPLLDPKWIIVGVAVAQISGIEMGKFIAAANNQKLEQMSTKPDIHAVKTPKEPYQSRTDEPVGEPV